MRGKFTNCIIFTLVSTAMWGQAPAETPAFIAADIHLTAKNDNNFAPGMLRGTQLEIRGMTMLTIAARAYGVDVDHLVGGPRWVDLDKFDILAKVPAGTKNDGVPPMLKKLLAERFGLEAHEDKRALPSFVLTLGKGKLKLVPATGETRVNITPSPDSKFRQVLTCRGYTVANFAGLLRNLGSSLVTSPVIDKTGLTGSYDFDFEFTQPQQMAAAGSEGISMFDALERLGLKLEQQSTPQQVVVIDRVNQTPTENEPGVEALMDPPPPPPVIDVATIKPAAPVEPGRGFGWSIRSDPQGMLFDGRNMRVSNLIQMGWELTPDRTVSLPKEADSQAFDIVMRVNSQMGIISTRTIAPIMQDLLKERFHLKAHLEDRPVDAYRLVAVKPKMAKADPENRAGCKDGPAPGAKDPRQEIPSRSRLFTCRNITMAEFAERLQNLSSGYVRTPIVDATKLEGMWDFTLNFSPPPPSTLPGAVAPTAASTAAAAAAPTPLAADPSEALNLFDAITSQLGLKLEPEKRMLPVLVVEHIDDGPTEN